MTDRTYVRIDWERVYDGALSPYLSITRHDQEVERIPLTRQDVARLVADGAYLWSVVEPRRGADITPSGELPHFIGAWGE